MNIFENKIVPSHHGSLSGAYPMGQWGSRSPTFSKYNLEICPKMLGNRSKRAFPRICESLNGVVQNVLHAYAPRRPQTPPTTGVLVTPLLTLHLHAISTLFLLDQFVILYQLWTYLLRYLTCLVQALNAATSEKDNLWDQLIGL